VAVDFAALARESPTASFDDPRGKGMRRLLLTMIGLTLANACVGCGPENPLGRKALWGKVTLDGGPLEQGTVEFHPMQQGGVESGGRIVAGSYKIPAHEGAPPGQYRVSIIDFVPTPPLPPGHMPGDDLPPSPKPKVPPAWNSKSDHKIEVKKEGPFEFNFDISTKDTTKKK